MKRFKDYDDRQIAQNAPYRHDDKKLIALSEQGRRDIAQLLAAEALSAPKINQNDARRDQQRGEREGAAERL